MAWETLLAIQEQNAEDWRNERRVACPNDGTVLLEAPDGGLYCQFDGWRP